MFTNTRFVCSTHTSTPTITHTSTCLLRTLLWMLLALSPEKYQIIFSLLPVLNLRLWHGIFIKFLSLMWKFCNRFSFKITEKFRGLWCWGSVCPWFICFPCVCEKVLLFILLWLFRIKLLIVYGMEKPETVQKEVKFMRFTFPIEQTIEFVSVRHVFRIFKMNLNFDFILSV